MKRSRILPLLGVATIVAIGVYAVGPTNIPEITSFVPKALSCDSIDCMMAAHDNIVSNRQPGSPTAAQTTFNLKGPLR